jgi:hypothetical protein
MSRKVDTLVTLTLKMPIRVKARVILRDPASDDIAERVRAGFRNEAEPGEIDEVSLDEIVSINGEAPEDGDGPDLESLVAAALDQKGIEIEVEDVEVTDVR